jgi:hypothetical protein
MQAFGTHPEVGECGKGAWIDLSRSGTGAERLEMFRIGMPQQRLSQLRAGGVGGTNEQDTGFAGHCEVSAHMRFNEYMFSRMQGKELTTH